MRAERHDYLTEDIVSYSIPHFDIWLPAWDKRPMLTVRPFSDEQARLLVNLRQRYEVWMAAERTRADLPYALRRQHISGSDKLYRIYDRGGKGQSPGPTNPAGEIGRASGR